MANGEGIGLKNGMMRVFNVIKKGLDLIDEACFTAGAKLAQGISNSMIGGIFTFIFPLEMYEAKEMIEEGMPDKENNKKTKKAVLGVGILSALIAAGGFGLTLTLLLNGVGLVSTLGVSLYPMILVGSLFVMYAAHLALLAYKVWQGDKKQALTNSKLSEKSENIPENQSLLEEKNTSKPKNLTSANSSVYATTPHEHKKNKIELAGKTVELVGTSLVLLGIIFTTDNAMGTDSLTGLDLGELDLGFTSLEKAALFLIVGAVLGIITKMALAWAIKKQDKNEENAHMHDSTTRILPEDATVGSFSVTKDN